MGVIVTARLKSTRLKRKVLKPLAGIPLAKFLVDRMKAVRSADLVIINTSTNPLDDELVTFANSQKIES